MTTEAREPSSGRLAALLATLAFALAAEFDLPGLVHYVQFADSIAWVRVSERAPVEYEFAGATRRCGYTYTGYVVDPIKGLGRDQAFTFFSTYDAGYEGGVRDFVVIAMRPSKQVIQRELSMLAKGPPSAETEAKRCEIGAAEYRVSGPPNATIIAMEDRLPEAPDGPWFRRNRASVFKDARFEGVPFGEETVVNWAEIKRVFAALPASPARPSSP